MVTLDITQTKFHTGTYSESRFVVAEGWYDDNVFHILALGRQADSCHTLFNR